MQFPHGNKPCSAPATTIELAASANVLRRFGLSNLLQVKHVCKLIGENTDEQNIGWLKQDKKTLRFA